MIHLSINVYRVVKTQKKAQQILQTQDQGQFNVKKMKKETDVKLNQITKKEEMEMNQLIQ